MECYNTKPWKAYKNEANPLTYNTEIIHYTYRYDKNKWKDAALKWIYIYTKPYHPRNRCSYDSAYRVWWNSFDRCRMHKQLRSRSDVIFRCRDFCDFQCSLRLFRGAPKAQLRYLDLHLSGTSGSHPDDFTEEICPSISVQFYRWFFLRETAWCPWNVDQHSSNRYRIPDSLFYN